MRSVQRSRLGLFLLVFFVLTSASLACGKGTPTPKPMEIVITSPGVLKRIDSTMILQTTVFKIDTVVRAKKKGGPIFNWGGQNLLLFVQGTVKAGVDLGELGEDDIEVSQERKIIIVTLPPAKVLSAVLDDHQVENYKGEKPEKVDLTLLEEGLQKGKEQIATTACESGILKYATTDAEKAFSQILGFMDLAGYEVTVKTTPATECSIEIK